MISAARHNPDLQISRFMVIGITYRLADAATRSLFSISPEQARLFLEEAKGLNIKSAFVLSTCNRTEIYAYSPNENIILNLLLKHSKGTQQLLNTAGFIKTGSNALNHLFTVAAGLDSQIIGDYEILGQLKNAVAFSRHQNMIGSVMDRTINFVQQAAKDVRTKTALSTGTVSVSYAAIEWLKNNVEVSGKKLLLIGTGKFGTNMAKNVKHYFPEVVVTIMNRTDATAKTIADSLCLNWQPYSSLKEEVNSADIVLVCTNANGYIIHPDLFCIEKKQWLIDLSVPENIHPDVKNIGGKTVAGVDEISQIMETTMAKRKKEIPKVLSIMEKHQVAFYNWLKMQQHVPVINEMKTKLHTLGERHFSQTDDKQKIDTKINKAVGVLAVNLRQKNEKGCQYINAISDFLNKDAVQ